MFGKLSWSGDPVRPADPADRPASSVVVASSACSPGHRQGPAALSVARVDHQRRPQAHRRHVHPAALVMLLRGFADAIMMRSQQAVAFHAPGYLPPEHYNQIFSAHGTIMIFFAAMPFVIGLMNFVVPLQLGVRDVAFPTLNSVSFWLTATGALLVNISLVVGEFARTGWLPYPPLSELDLFARRRRRLLPLGAADLRHRHADDGDKLRHHRAEDARARA